MKIVVASDSFKGTLRSAEVARVVSEEAARWFPDADTVGLAVADGGEGTVDALVTTLGGHREYASVRGPLGDPVEAAYGLLPGRRAIVEMAAASGLTLVDVADRDPLRTSTYGTGQLIIDALDFGAREVLLAIGGSATNDCGMGAMRALGVRFLDASGGELEGVGADLARVETVDLSGMDPRIAETSFSVMCDVDNPLLGPHGATRVYAPQKGASPAQVDEAERGMEHFAAILERSLGVRVADVPGAGAAGGLGAAAIAFLGARIVSGVDLVLDLVGMDEALAGASLCITGEGHADAQSLDGKLMSGVASRCQRAGVPCVAIVGGMSEDACALLRHGVDALVPSVIDACDISEALSEARTNLRLAAGRTFSLISLGERMGR